MNKQTILTALQSLPDEVELDEVMERLIFIERVEEGLRQSENGETVSHEEVVRLAKSWGK